MKLIQHGRYCTKLLRSTRPSGTLLCSHGQSHRRQFHPTPKALVIKPQLLADIGEGIREVQIIQWYVQEGARVEAFDSPLCEVQSDKASVDINARYAGIIKKLHYQADDTVPTGKALCDIDVDGEVEDEAPMTPQPEEPTISQEPRISVQQQGGESNVAQGGQEAEKAAPEPRSKHATLATPAVRGLLKELDVNITDVTGTGKEGRVLKEDVHKFVADRDSGSPSKPQDSARPSSSLDTQQKETPTPLTPIQAQMFKTMTRSLSIPHFLYTDELNIASLASLRTRLMHNSLNPQKLSYLPFIIKAVSLALDHFPMINARVDTTTDPNKPKLIMRTNHNVGVAMDTPQGLLVPNIKNVGARSILDIASELSHLGSLAKDGKLSAADLSGGTITVSNIGSIGGTYVAPVIVPTEVSILGVGKSRTLPVFDEEGKVVKGEMVNFSWSADHRVVDGATMARMAEKVKGYVEAPEMMVLDLR